MIRLSWLPDLERVRWSGSGERLSAWPASCTGSVVFHVTKGKITDAANKQAVESSYKALSKAPHVASAPDPFANAASGLVSKDAKTAFTPVLLDIPNGEVTEELAGEILATTAPAQKAGVDSPSGATSAASCPSRRPRAARSSACSPPC
jgi:hypothetical protein